VPATIFRRVTFHPFPTLNTEAILENCLAAIARQTYPLTATKLSCRRTLERPTREIGKKFARSSSDDNGKTWRKATARAPSTPTGEFIFFVDATMKSRRDYIELAVKALDRADRKALGVEGYYLPSPKMSSFCAYVRISPHQRSGLLADERESQLVARDGDVERWILPPGTFSYPLGANGFVYRRADLQSVQANEKFQDTHVAMFLRKTASANGCGFMARRCIIITSRRCGASAKTAPRTVHFLRVQEEMRGTG